MMGDPVARSRWRILAKALSRSNSFEDPADDELDSNTSLRRFQTYGLISTIPLVNLQEPEAAWFEYHTSISQENLSVVIRHPKHSFTAADLMGFNNTGNVCVWPSEETLAFFCMSNRQLFAGKSVIEIGGGMSCLAALMVAKYTSAERVVLTDGNELAMANVGKILEKNGLGELPHVSSQVLQWGKHGKIGRFDVILCADCLFFDEDRCDLIQTISDLLSEKGVVLVAAPQRGDTLEKFIEEACSAGFVCALHRKYNRQVWQCHIDMQATEGSLYDEDIHYPLLLTMTKVGTPNDIHCIVSAGWADYWKSQPRKMCEFCKCWIADNKPSIQFHESGKKHKENVAKRLAEIGKKSAKDCASQKSMEKSIKKMEQAAMKAYLKDMEGNCNADLTAQKVKFEAEERHRIEAENRVKDAKAKARETKAVRVAQEALEKKRKLDEVKRVAALKKSVNTKWYEAKSEQGHTYYWHIETNETNWDPPEDGYLTTEEQKIAEEDEKRREEEKASREKEIKEKKESELVEKKRKALAEADEFFKKSKKTKSSKAVAMMGPAQKADPYGKWKAIETKVEEPVDLQLPFRPVKEVYKPPTVPMDSRPKTLFQEKTITSISSEFDEDVKPCSSVTFKKKSGFRGNARQRLDTDD